MTNNTQNVPEVKKVLFATSEQYIEVLIAHGIDWTVQSGFLKVSLPGARLYIANTKTVRRVDLSGFEIPFSRCVTRLPKGGTFGKVKQQMIVGEGPENDLATFEEVLLEAASLPAPEVKTKTAPVKEVPQVPAEVLTEMPDQEVLAQAAEE